MSLSVSEVLSYESPLEYAETPNALSACPDAEYVSDWEQGSFFSQMLDVWGEVKRALDCADDADRLARQLDTVREICCVLYSEGEERMPSGAKWEMKVAEWMLYDYLAGGNRWHQSERSAIGWWYSMSHGINYALV